VLHNRRIRDPDPAVALSPGDRIIVLARRSDDQPPGHPPASGAARRPAHPPASAQGQGNAGGQ
jgi:hypothetical protein